jgi:hypothetical protein
MANNHIDREIAEELFEVLKTATENYMRLGMNEEEATAQVVAAMSDYVEAFKGAMKKHRMKRGQLDVMAADGSRLHVH